MRGYGYVVNVGGKMNKEEVNDKIWDGIYLDITENIATTIVLLLQQYKDEYLRVGKRKGFLKKDIEIAYHFFGFSELVKEYNINIGEK